MPRYDKYDPYVGGFRAALAEAISAEDSFTVYGVGLDSNGHVVLGAGQTEVAGVLIAHGAKKVGDIVDVMTSGEIVEFTADGTPDGAAAAAGTNYGAGDDGAVSAAGATHIGHTVEAQRLVVRVHPTQNGGA
uniref:Minor capsid protein n=1 Tax=Micrococcus phage Kurnik TaxID=3092208 RepID=A0AAU6R5B9_9CAUD